MATILADKDILRLIGTVLVDADEELVNPNGIELRLGKHVAFHSTGEEKELVEGSFLKVSPGESISISSIELINFKADTVQAILPGAMIMGLITPTTTMMREGISQVATKIDAGFKGVLNWGLRNGSTKDLILQYGEPIFKLTLFALSKEEHPEIPYGTKDGDSYQNSTGIVRSTRRIPADIPKSKIVSSSFEKLDPKKQLREAGYPFDHIGTELTSLHGKFELVSTDVRLMRDQFQKTATELTDKIQSETTTLSQKLDDTRKHLIENAEILFDRKFMRVAGIIIGAIPIMYGGVTFLRESALDGNAISFIVMLVGAVVVALSVLLTRRVS